MINLSLKEAQLFRKLQELFGTDNIIFNMSIHCICEGNDPKVKGISLDSMKLIKCLFTIINREDSPRLVMELAFDSEGIVDLVKLEQQKVSQQVFNAIGLPYLVISNDQFDAILDPSDSYTLTTLLNQHFGIVDADVA